MQSKPALTRSVCWVTLAILTLPLFNMMAQTQQTKDTIKMLIEADEFKASEREVLQALPIDALPLLTSELRNIPKTQNHTRAFFLLATKFAQCEAQMEATHRDAAVNALLDRIMPSPNPTDDEAVSVRGNLKQLSGITDQRIIDAISAAHTALNGEEPKKEAMPQGGSISDVIKPIQPTAKVAEAKPAPAPSEEPTSSTSWSIIVVLIVAAGGLLWLLLKRRS
jgi:hypothetical protein